MLRPAGLIGPSYADDTKPLSVQETINWIPQLAEAEGQRSVISFKGSPGLQQFATTQTARFRGWTMFDDEVYAVFGTHLYKIGSDGSSTNIGVIAGSKRCGMAVNTTQLVIVNGAQGYVYDGTTLTQITDTDFVGSDSVTFVDQYGVFDGSGGQFYISALADFTSYDALDFATAEASPDPTLAVFVDHLELWVFGSETIEIWRNTGDPDFPFERNTGVIVERGLGAVHSIAKIDNTVYWVGEDGFIYSAQGYTPKRISTFPIEQELSGNFSNCHAFTYRDKGHWYYCLQLPEDGKSFIYDASTGLWHRRKSYKIDRWRVDGVIRAYGKLLAADVSSGAVWEMRDDVYKEGDDPLIAERITQYTHANQNPVFGHVLELVWDTGHGLTTGQGSDPVVQICWSDDGGHTWNNWKSRSLGKIGEYGKRVRYHRLGRFRNRAFHIRISDPIKRDFLAASGFGEAGDSL